MVKKNYLSPVSSEIRTKLRTTLLAGSYAGTGAGSNPTGSATSGSVPTSNEDPVNNGGTFGDAKARFSLD
ncbi:MAG: hypothetical protein K6E54_05080 [Bacteroidaceae bacterium]|jgi:hypothetical protein|nr:hypothetical protein [Bacteroidaceae bacterium]